MTVYAVHTSDTGQLISVGTVVANPLPAELTALALTGTDAAMLRDGTGTWDAAARTVIARPVPVEEANRATIGDRVATHLTALRAIKGSTGTLTGAQLSNAARAIAAALLDVIRYLHNRVDTID